MAHRGVRRENRDREGELEIPLNANIISILNRRFVKDYLVYLESRERKSYVSEFSQKMLKQLVEAYRCGGELNSLLKSASQYLDELVQGAAQVFPQVLVLNVELASRLTVACASRHLPIEVSIAWDQILNIPYIPSSGIKGLVRAYFE
ncbi:MAG: hypothetical protein NZ912_01215, partial [Ignisphaera sp.]|nr:hypothetical protein [Ignisphaera sp.]